MHILGLVDNMDELMSVANVMVTKPGGLSIAEALVKKLPMLFFSAIPGQETNNIKVLSTYGLSQGQSSLPKSHKPSMSGIPILKIWTLCDRRLMHYPNPMLSRILLNFCMFDPFLKTISVKKQEVGRLKD